MPTYRDHLQALLGIIETDALGHFYIPENDRSSYVIGRAILYIETESEPWSPTAPQNPLAHL